MKPQCSEMPFCPGGFFTAYPTKNKRALRETPTQKRASIRLPPKIIFTFFNQVTYNAFLYRIENVDTPGLTYGTDRDTPYTSFGTAGQTGYNP